MSTRRWPEGRRFAFSVVDDTDNATVANVGPVYRLLTELGIRTTKTVWVYPPRDQFRGESLADPGYVAFVQELQRSGFEIALHNIGSGPFTRAEILEGLERFNTLLGHYPRMHVNHVSNPDNIYWGPRRFRAPVRWAYGAAALLLRLLRGRRPTPSGGDDPDSAHYWGDALARHVRYVRNLTFSGLDTLAIDPRMPYHDPRKPLVARWFSSADGHTADHFVDLLRPDALDALERQGGGAIVYTHFTDGFVVDGRVRPDVEVRLRDLAGRQGWYVPASDLLDHLGAAQGDSEAGEGYLRTLECRWFLDRIRNFLRYRR